MIRGVHVSSGEMIIQKDGNKPFDIAALKKNQVITARMIKHLPHGKALLLINGKPVSARTGLLLTPGEEIQLKVTEKQDDLVLKPVVPARGNGEKWKMIRGVHVSSGEMIIQKDGNKPFDIAALKKNQVITARVIKHLPHGKALLLINGKPVSARTGLLLTPGEEIQLKVTEKQDDLVLKLVAPARKMTSRQVSSLIRFFSENTPIPDMAKGKLPKAERILSEIAVKSERPDHEFLPRLMERSGLLMESKIAREAQAQTIRVQSSAHGVKSGIPQLVQQDLKAAFLREAVETGRAPDVLKTISSFLETLENFQQLNLQSSESGRYLLPLPVFSNSAFRFGQLMIDTGDSSSESNDPDKDKVIRISFLLDMSNLGPIRADFSILKKAVTGCFLLADPQTTQYVGSMIPGLKKRLAGVDFQVQHIECKTAPPDELRHDSLVERLVKNQGDHVLHIIA